MSPYASCTAHECLQHTHTALDQRHLNIQHGKYSRPGREQLSQLPSFSGQQSHTQVPDPTYILSAALPCRAWVVSSALSRSAPASSALRGACAPFSRKWLMKSFKPSRSTPSFGLSDTLERNRANRQHSRVLGRETEPGFC